jgi:phosphate transport system permease protein
LPKPVGETGGGMANAIVGTGELLLISAAAGIPIGLLGGIYLAEYAGHRSAAVIRYAADLLNGAPSIIVGILAYVLVVVPMRRFSALAGGLALGMMLIPIVLRTSEAALLAVPQSLREAAVGLGARHWKAIVTVVMPAALRGIVTAALLGLARVAGETAPLLFTSFGNPFWSTGLDQPTAALPLLIYDYAISPYDDWHRQAWAAGLVLLVLVLSINVITRSVLHKQGALSA